MPNPNTIPWLHYQDIQIPDYNLQQLFMQYYKQGQYQEALSLLAGNSAQLRGKAFIASTINTIASGLLTLENYYNTGVTVFLSNLATQYQQMVNNLKRAGNWNAALQYTPYNFVRYNDEIYMCIEQPPIGTLPTDDTYWLYLNIRGIEGDPGIDVVMRYDWNGTDTYNINDLVVYNDTWWVALQQNTNVVPGENANVWLEFVYISKTEIYVNINPPSSPFNNTAWFKPQADPSVATTTTPIIGQFYRYVEQTQAWDEMYPNVLFQMLDGSSKFVPVTLVLTVNTSQGEWGNRNWKYRNIAFSDATYVDVLPVLGMSSAQQAVYDSFYSISVNSGFIRLETTIYEPSPDLDFNLDLRIIIRKIGG